MSATHKTWVYTLNNFTLNELDNLKMLDVQTHYASVERGTSGTRHLQGSITFKRAYRLSQLKKLFDRAHWEPAKTCDPQNYVLKSDSHVVLKVNKKKSQKMILTDDIWILPAEERSPIKLAVPRDRCNRL